MGLLKVTVVSARGVADTDRGFAGKSDPYVVVAVKGQTKQTRVVRDCLDPVWNESYDFEVQDTTTEVVQFLMWDQDSMRQDTIIASAAVSLNLLQKGQQRRLELPLLRSGEEGCSSGCLTVDLLAVDFSGLEAEVQRLNEIGTELKQQVEQLQETEGRLKADVAALGTEVQQLREVENKLSQEVATLQEVEGRLSEELGLLKEVESNLREEVSQLKDVEGKLNGDVADLGQKLKLMQTTVDDLAKTRDILDAQVDKLDEQNESLQKQLNDLRTIEEGMKAFAAQAGADYEAFVQQLTSQISRNEKLLTDFAQENAKLRENRRQQQVNMLLQMSSSFAQWDHKVGLSPEEFTQYINLLGPEYERKIRERIGPTDDNVFGILDADKSGTLNLGELRKLLEEISKEV